MSVLVTAKTTAIEPINDIQKDIVSIFNDVFGLLSEVGAQNFDKNRYENIIQRATYDDLGSESSMKADLEWLGDPVDELLKELKNRPYYIHVLEFLFGYALNRVRIKDMFSISVIYPDDYRFSVSRVKTFRAPEVFMIEAFDSSKEKIDMLELFKSLAPYGSRVALLYLACVSLGAVYMKCIFAKKNDVKYNDMMEEEDRKYKKWARVDKNKQAVEVVPGVTLGDMMRLQKVVA